MKSYHIKEGYTPRLEYHQYDNTPMTDEFQKEVYEKARKICDKNKFNKILDIGCGSGYKLVKYFRDKKFTGLELEPNLSFLKDKHPFFDFRLSDFQNPPKEKFDLVICSDVVEHLIEPDDLIEFIKKINFDCLVLSTPDRDIIQQLQMSFGWNVELNGPPHNKHHVREWTSNEFGVYIGQHFNIVEHYCAPVQKECQIVVAKKK